MFQVNTIVLIIMVVLVTYQGDADPTISTSTPTPCYGDVVTLVCHHPEVVSNPGRYFTQTPVWNEDDATITIADGTVFTVETVADLTRTFLTINITVDHFRNKSFKYSCELVLADENGRPFGEVETSGEVTVDPVDQLPIPVNIATFSNSTTAVLTVSFDPRCCNTAQLTVDITTNSSSATTPLVHPVDSTDPTNTTIVITDITEGVCYTASIQSVCEDNNLLEDSGVLIVNFMTIDEKDPIINGTDSTDQPSSPATAPPLSVVLPIVIIFIVVPISIGVVMIVTVVCWLNREPNHGQYRIADGEEKLVLLQVCDALNRHNATIHSVQGETVSLHPPAEESFHTDIWGEYKESKFVAKFVYAITEEDVLELIQEKGNSCSDRGFLLSSKKTVSTFLTRLRQEDCEFVHVKNLPWKIGSREERTFVETFNSHFLVSEGAATDVIARGGAFSSRDFEQLLFALFPNLKKESKSSPESKAQTRSSKSPSPLSEQPHRSRPVYKRSTFIDGVVSILEILHVTILSVRGRCRRPQCSGSTNCTHLGEYRPDIHCQYKEKSFVVKCKVRHRDGEVTREDVEILSQIREGVEAALGCLVCDDLDMSEEVEEMLAPYNCLKAVVGLYSWNSFWVKNAIVALFPCINKLEERVVYACLDLEGRLPIPAPPTCSTDLVYTEVVKEGEEEVLKMMNTPPAIPEKGGRWPQLHSPQKEFQSAVLAQLCQIGLDMLQKRDNVIVGKYKGEDMVIVCVSAEEKITMGDVQTLRDARSKAGASIGFLICDQEMITYDAMKALKDNNCIHVLVGGCGKSVKWEDEMTRKFEEAFEALMTPQEEVGGRIQRQLAHVKVDVNRHPQHEPIRFSVEESKQLIPDNTEPLKSHSPLGNLLWFLPKNEDVQGSQKLNSCSANDHCKIISLANDESQITLPKTSVLYSQEQSEYNANSEMVTGNSMTRLYAQPQNNSFETDHDDWITFDIELQPVSESNPCEKYMCAMQTMDSPDGDKNTDCDSGFVE